MDREKIRRAIETLTEEERKSYELIETVSENRIQNAIDAYATGCKREEIVAMVDTTFRKNGKAGLLITTERIYGNKFLEHPIEFEGLEWIGISDGRLNYPVMVYENEIFRDTKIGEARNVEMLIPVVQKLMQQKGNHLEKQNCWDEIHEYYGKHLRKEVEKAISQYSLKDKEILLRDKADKVIIENALANYANEVTWEEVIAVLPQPYSKGATGYLITERGIYNSYNKHKIQFDGLIFAAFSEQKQEDLLFYYENKKILRNALILGNKSEDEFLKMIREIIKGYQNVAKMATKEEREEFSVIHGWKQFLSERKKENVESYKNSVFISSTFVDMHYERDMIHERVLPAINKAGEEYGQQISFCDLRWGVNTGDLDNDDGSKKILSVCMEEIERCRPYMLVILGERYGWIPEENLIRETTKRYPEIELDELEKSVTALEIEFGALSKEGQLGRTLFYFRKMNGTPAEKYQSEDDYHAQKLALLKERINQIAANKVKTYHVEWDEENQCPTGFDEFVNMVTEDLKALMEEEWKREQSLTAFEKESELHWKQAERNALQCKARDKMILSCMDYIKEENHLLAVVGDSGCGKSVLMGALATVLRLSNAQVLPIYCGYTKTSDTAISVIRSMVYFLEEKLDLEHETLEKEEDWIMHLEKLVKEYSGKEQKIVFVLDAIDQLQEDQIRNQLKFIPKEFSDSVYLIFSCSSQFELPYIPVKIIVPLLEKKERREAIAGILELQRRELAPVVIDAIVEKRESGHPLYIKLLIQRLVMMNKNDYEIIAGNGGGIEAITAHQCDIVSKSPEYLDALCAEVLKDATERIGKGFVKEALSCIANSKYGLRESDLGGILTEEGYEWNALDFSLFINYMRSLFLLRDDGRYDFSHKMIRKGLEEKEEHSELYHQKLAKWMKQLPQRDPVRMQELYYHCFKIDDDEGFVDYIKQYYEDSEVIERAASDMALECLKDNGRKLARICAGGKNIGVDVRFLKFICFEIDRAIGASEKELRVEERLMQECLAVSKELAKESAEAEIKRMVSLFNYRIGSIYKWIGGIENLQIGLAYFKESMKICKQILEIEPTEKVQRDIALDTKEVGKMYMYLGGEKNLELALGYFQESAKMFEHQVEQSGTAKSRNDLGNAYLTMADVYEKMESCQEKQKEFYLKSQKIWEQLVKEEVTENVKKNLALSYEKLADLYCDQENRKDALVFYQKANDLLEEVAASNKVTYNVKRLMVNYVDLGVTYQMLDQELYAKEALECYEKGVALLEFLIYDENNESLYAKLGYTYRNVSELRFELGGAENQKEASRVAWEAYKIFEMLVKKYDTNEHYDDYINACKDVQRYGHYQSDAESRKVFREKFVAALEEMYKRTKNKEYKSTIKKLKLIWKLEKACG